VDRRRCAVVTCEWCPGFSGRPILEGHADRSEAARRYASPPGAW
jgi:hypothetical protein